MRYWWVNQRHTWNEERRAGILWAPMKGNGGRTQKHWDNMDDVKVGDVVLHYVEDSVRAVSQVTAGARRAPRPSDMVAVWEMDGRLITVSYQDVFPFVYKTSIPSAIRRGENGKGPFNVDLNVKQGYLWPASTALGDWFLDQFAERLTSDPRRPSMPPALPAEAQESGKNLLRRLIGEHLSTVTGAINVVLAVTEHTAVVATTNSPQGQSFPIYDLDVALESLRHNGFVLIHPDSVGYRSAFVGAVLLTLPGATVSGTPPVITVNVSDVPAVAPSAAEPVSFEGELSQPRTAEERREQSRLRRLLVGTATAANCAFCGQAYPVRFLHAGHVKKRAACSDEEKRDLANIAVLACLFGCDALYEHGYIAVDSRGIIVCSSGHKDDLDAHYDRLRGRTVSAYTVKNANYFDWHFRNKFLG